MVIKKVAMYLFMQFICCNNLYADIVVNEIFIKDKLCDVKAFGNGLADNKASLQLQMTLKKHASGVAYAVFFELKNNTDKSLVIRTPSDNAERFMPVIQLTNDQKISNEHKRYKMDGLEQPNFEEITIKAGSTKTWRLNLKYILQTSEDVKKALVNNSEGLLMVFFYFRYFLEDKGCDKQYKDGKINFYQNEHFSLESYLLPN
ncbi:hypothetical protein [Methylovulum sp.]|uniref:hypothetical protein n=1 Tax=Methylovulum sp. TaxID=1916980 RepID=UPI002638D081|nr:hypothetical protein [Methylovulum sp.]MDD5125539.1 hypothetical protein [Methylovulum sp.]